MTFALFHTVALALSKNSETPVFDWLMMPLGWLCDLYGPSLTARLPDNLYYPVGRLIYSAAHIANSFLWGAVLAGCICSVLARVSSRRHDHAA